MTAVSSELLDEFKALEALLRSDKVRGLVRDPARIADCLARYLGEPERGLDRAFGLSTAPGHRTLATLEADQQRRVKCQQLREEFYDGLKPGTAAREIEHDAREHVARRYVPPKARPHRGRYEELIKAAIKPNGEVYSARKLARDFARVSDMI